MSSERNPSHDIRAPSPVRVVKASPSPHDSTIAASHDGPAATAEHDHEATHATHDDRRSTAHAHAPRRTADAHAHAHAHASRPTADAHAHAHAHAHDEPADAALSGRFPHEKLDAYRVALELAALSKKLAEQIPRGHRSIADHLLRASSNTVLLFAEGANRRGSALKRQRFVESRGECAEVAAAADLLLVLEIGSPSEAEKLKHLAGRVSAMLTRLIARLV